MPVRAENNVASTTGCGGDDVGQARGVPRHDGAPDNNEFTVCIDGSFTGSA